MKWVRSGLIAALIAVLLPLGGDAAWAHGRGGHSRGGIHWGVVIGSPFYWPWYYPPYPYASYPPVVVTPEEPPVYIERSTPQNAYWYYCPESNSYYPYVKECPSGWQRETPRAPE